MIKEFLNEWNEASDKHERAQVVENHINEVAHVYLEKSHKNEQQLRKLRSIFLSPKFAKALYKLTVKERSEEVSNIVVMVLADILISNPIGEEDAIQNAQLSLTDEVSKMYLEIIELKLKKRVKKLVKKTGFNESIVKNLLLECPDTLEETNGAQAYFFINKVLRKMYGLYTVAADDAEKAVLCDPDKIDDLVSYLMGDDAKLRLAFNILLEKYEKTKYFNDDQLEMWNALSHFALMTIEDIGKKKAIASELEAHYIKRRRIEKKNQRDGQRRLDLTEVNKEDYPKTAKAVDFLIKEYGDDIKAILS